MAKTDKGKPNPFADAIEKCAEVRGKLCAGLTAMGKNSAMVKVSDTRLLNGSLDIDNAVKAARPNEARWDYAIGYRDNAYFVEVHPADTKNVDEMVKKVTWLKQWLDKEAPELKELHSCGSFHWIPSGRVKILKTSPQYKRISANNLSLAQSTPLILK